MWDRPDFLELPERDRKPRSRGLSHVLDKGVTTATLEALLDQAGDFVDVLKIGWGIAYVDPTVKERVALCTAAGVTVSLGGTLLEVCEAQGRVDELRRWAAGIGIQAIEVSDGLQAMTPARKAELIRSLSADFVVFAETGAKDGDAPVVTEQWLAEMDADLEAGASWVIAEGRESGTVGLYHADGSVRTDLVDAIAARLPLDRVIFEAPRKAAADVVDPPARSRRESRQRAAGRGPPAGDLAAGTARGHGGGAYGGVAVIPDPAPNTITRPYRGLSVQEVDVPLTELELVPYLLGREVYRRTDYLVLRNRGETAVVAVRKASTEPLFSPVIEARVLAVPDRRWSRSTAPDTDVGNASALARAALAQRRDGVRAYVVQGRYEHVNFIWEPAPVRIRVTEVVPPEPTEAAGDGRAGRRLRRGPAADRARSRRGRHPRTRRRQPVGAVPAAVPRLRRRAGRRCRVPGHPPGATTGLADDRVRAVAAVPPAFLRRRATPRGHLPPPAADGRRRRPWPSVACSNAGSRSTGGPPSFPGAPTSTRSGTHCAA